MTHSPEPIQYPKRMSIRNESDYRAILKAALRSRSLRNPSYSLRSFARDLGLPPPQLSDVLNGKYGISATTAAKIANNLGFSEPDRQHFCLLVESVHARSRIKRELAKQELQRQRETQRYAPMEAESFCAVSEWYHFAILELTYVAGFKLEPIWIAKRLGITPGQARDAIQALKDQKSLTLKDDQWIASEEFTAAPQGTPMEAKRKFHRQILEKAHHAIEAQPFEKRDFSAMIMAVSAEQLPEAKRLLQKFRARFNRLMNAAPSKNKVYCLSVQFFSLEES